MSGSVRPSLRECTLVVALSLSTSAAGALALGQDASVDLLNYHFYNGYALLNHRLDHDLAPAGHASYFNPLVDALQYAALRHLSPTVATALLGSIQGLNVVLVWGIARLAFGAHGVWAAPLAALLAATGQNAVSLLGTTYSDNTASIPALAALLFLAREEGPGRGRLLLAGACGGAAVGLKLTMAAPYVGLAVLAGWIAGRQRRGSLALAFAFGSVLGWTATNGWWAFAMWRRFGNPVFPFLNDLFRSPFAPLVPVRDQRWVAHTLLDWLTPPFHAATGVPSLQELPVRDGRLLLVCVVLLASIVARLRRRTPLGRPATDLTVYWVATYAAWLAAFRYYRYATVVEFLAPVVTLALLIEVWPERRVLSATAVAAMLLLTTNVSPWPREKERRPFWFNPRLSIRTQRAEQLILLPEGYSSFAIPFFPSDTAFVGLWGFQGPALADAIAARIRVHHGPLLVLERTADSTNTLARFGLTRRDDCDWLKFGRGNRLRLCLVERWGSGLGPVSGP